MLIATAQPPFSSPSIRSAGTTTSSKNTSANSRSPLIISSGATVIPGVSMSTKNAVMPRWRESGGPGAREQHAAVGVLRQAGPDLLAVDHPRRRGARRRRREPRGSAATQVAARCPAPRSPGTTARRPRAGGARPRRRASGGAKSMSVGASTSISEKSPGSARSRAGERRAELGAQHRRAAAAADALRPAVLHPARVEQDRLHALHLGDVVVERSGRGVTAARAPRGARRATRASSARKSAMRQSARGCSMRRRSDREQRLRTRLPSGDESRSQSTVIVLPEPEPAVRPAMLHGARRRGDDLARGPAADRRRAGRRPTAARPTRRSPRRPRRCSASRPTRRVDDAQRAITAARRAFDTTAWSTRPALRVRCLRQLHQALLDNVEPLREILVQEVGAPVSSTSGPQLEAPIDVVRLVRRPARGLRVRRRPRRARHLRRPAPPLGREGSGRCRRRDHGVQLSRSSSRSRSSRPRSPPAARSCSRVRPTRRGRRSRSASSSPRRPTSRPASSTCSSSSDNAVGAELTTHPDVDVVSFTGSTPVGRQIMAAASATVKRVFLELGGKSAFVLLDDGDLDDGGAVLLRTRRRRTRVRDVRSRRGSSCRATATTRWSTWRAPRSPASPTATRPIPRR